MKTGREQLLPRQAACYHISGLEHRAHRAKLTNRMLCVCAHLHIQEQRRHHGHSLLPSDAASLQGAASWGRDEQQQDRGLTGS